MLTQLTVQQYIDQLSSDAPTPGGGSALANVASQAVSLILMSCNVTITKLTKLKKHIPAELSMLTKEMSPYLQQLITLIDGDAECFDNILSAMRLPQNSKAEKLHRTQQLQRAYITSACTCLQLATICVHSCHLADIAIEVADKYVVSDAHIGKALLHTCAINCKHNIYANTCYITDSDTRKQLENDTTQLLAMLDKTSDK